VNAEPTTKAARISGGAGPVLRTQIELWIVIVFMALAFGAGITLGVIARQDPGPSVAIAPVTQPAGGTGAGGIFAPPLTDEQLQQGLPPNHPGVDQSGGGSSSGSGTGAKGAEGTSGPSSGSGGGP
jgi:hypothetical protein